jgi:hypothetical protein
MQKIATKVFICSSVVFGILGILIVLVNVGQNGSENMVLTKLFMVSIFVILPSFALSVASKYLGK